MGKASRLKRERRAATSAEVLTASRKARKRNMLLKGGTRPAISRDKDGNVVRIVECFSPAAKKFLGIL